MTLSSIVGWQKMSHLLVAASIFVASGSVQASGPISGINQLTFVDSKFNKSFVGNGFLISHKNRTYAVTVKHVLLEAKTPEMNSVSINKYISGWKIAPNKQPDKYVRLGRLLNASEQEALDMAILQKDWLIFEVSENRSDLQVLKIRNSELVPGETLTAFGCSYANKASCSQDEYQGIFIADEGNNLRVNMPDLNLSTLRGLSGSPVVDKDNLVVGIVSNVLPSKSGKGFDFAPANLNYLQQILATL